MYKEIGMCESLQWPLEQTPPKNYTLQRQFSSLAFAVQPRDAPLWSLIGVQPMAVVAVAGEKRWDLEAENPAQASANPLHLSFVPGVSSVRCHHSLRPRASLLLALPSPCLLFHWNGVKWRRVHAGSGTDQQVSWECLSGSQRAPSLLPGFL